jgi:hypothetical protein
MNNIESTIENNKFFIIKCINDTLKLLANENPNIFTKIVLKIAADKKVLPKLYRYVVNGVGWTVLESKTWKLTLNDNKDYHCFFSKVDGFNCRFGAKVSDDPIYCPLGPEIADIEIGAGACPKINGKNCAFCYKSNGGTVSYNMKFDEFKKLVDFMPKNLSQIAFGITGVYSNPDFFKIMEYAKSIGISPNYTTNGVDLDDAAIDKTLDLCGRIAVSCYEGAKEICYNTIKRVGEKAKERNKKFPCNMHIVISKDTYNHVMDVLNDVKNGKVENLGAIVFLRIKPVGRAKCLDCQIPKSMYEEIVKFCLDNNITFGFDSCGAKQVENVLNGMGKSELVTCIEPCESSKFSSYFNWKSEYWSCSFCENNHDIMNALDPFKFNSFSEFWNSNEINNVRFPKECKCESCPYYNLD